MITSLDTLLLVRVYVPGVGVKWIRKVPAACCVLSLLDDFVEHEERWPHASEFALAGPASVRERLIHMLPDAIYPKVGLDTILSWIALMVDAGGELLAHVSDDTYPDLSIDFDEGQYVIREPDAYWLAAYDWQQPNQAGGRWKLTLLERNAPPYAQPRDWSGDGRRGLGDRFVDWARVNMARQGMSLAALLSLLPHWVLRHGRERIRLTLRRSGTPVDSARLGDIEATAWALGYEVDLVFSPRQGKDLEDNDG